MWRNNVYNYGVLLHFTIFCCQISFFCNLRCFVAKSVLVRFTRFCVEKNLAKNCARGEKMTNMRYVQPQIISTLMMLMMLMVGITMHCNEDVDDDGGGSVNGGQTQITHILCLLSAPRLTPSPLTTILYQITMMKR